MTIHHQSRRPPPDPETEAMRAFIRAWVEDNRDPQNLNRLPPAMRQVVERFKDVLKRNDNAR